MLVFKGSRVVSFLSLRGGFVIFFVYVVSIVIGVIFNFGGIFGFKGLSMFFLFTFGILISICLVSLRLCLDIERGFGNFRLSLIVRFIG